MLELSEQYILGFFEGEGRFGIIIARAIKAKKGIQINLIFGISQAGERGEVLLNQIKDYFKCGHIYPRMDEKRNLPMYDYRVHRLYDIRKRIIPFFERNPPIIKKEEFEIWKEAALLLSRNEQFRDSGISRLIELKDRLEILNKGSLSLIPFAHKWRVKRDKELRDY